MTNRKCKIGKKAYAARRIAAVLMSATLAGTIAAGTPGIVQVSAASYSENSDYIFEVLTRKLGYSEAAACGIMANIRCESTFNPHAWNAGGGSYGLCQWTGGRYGRLQNWCRSNGYDYTTIDGQLAYLEYELQNHYKGVEDYLRSVENTSAGAYDAGQYYCYHFEAPASRGSVSVYRGGLASGTFWEAYRPAEWYFEDGVWRYIKRDGTYHKSWLTIDNKTYYLDENGNRISGWRTIDGNRYYFDKDGVMASGWVKIDGKDYYFGEDGPLITGLVMNGDSWFMLDEAGNIQASEEMARYASSWNEKNQGEALASADEQNADNGSAESVESTASAETEETAAGSDTSEQTSLVASRLTAPGDTKEASQNIAGMGIDKTSEETTQLPSISPAGAVDGKVGTETEETASAEDTVEETASSKSTIEDTDTAEEAAIAESTAEEAAIAESTAEEAAPTESTVEETAPAESTVEKTAQTAEEAAPAEEAPKTEESAKETTEEAPKTEESAKETAEDKDQGSDAAQAGAGISPSEIVKPASEEFAAADAMRAAAEATDEEAEEERPEGFFMIYDPAAEDNQSDDASTQTIAMILPQADETAETSETAEVLGIAEGAITAETAESAETDKTAETAEAEEKADNADTAKTVDLAGSAASIASENVEITLSDEILFLSPEDLDELVRQLDQKDLIQAVTKDGKDITDQVKAKYERIDSRGNAYKVVFTVDYQGKTSSLESVFYLMEDVR